MHCYHIALLDGTANNLHVFILQHRNIPYNLNSTVSVAVISMPYRIQPSALPTRATSVRAAMRKRWQRGRRSRRRRSDFGLTDPHLSRSGVSLPPYVLQMGTSVLWGTVDVFFAVPLWVIILAILVGLLVLALLTLLMWKVGAHVLRRCGVHCGNLNYSSPVLMV